MSKMSRIAARAATGVGVGVAVGAATLAGAAGVAGAAGPAGGTEVPGSVTPIGSYTAGTPFSSGQTVQINIPANSVLNPGLAVNILECQLGPGGALPTDSSSCDGTTIQGDTILAAANGSISYSNYTIYALPDAISLGETTPTGVTCNASTQCVLYIGQNQNDFTQPHFWSQPFYVTPNADDGGESPGDGSQNPGSGLPESPLAIGLPLAGVGIAGVVVARRRRRTVNA